MSRQSFFKRRLKLFLSLFFLFASFSVFGQDIDSRSPKPNGGSKQQQRADKKKAIQKKKIEKGIEKGKKRHLKLQTKNTRTMMRKSKKKSKHWNDR